MLSRREFLEIASATAALTALDGSLHRAAAQQRITQADLLRFAPKGQVTILHMTDCHAQLVPVYYREPSDNLGVGEMLGLPPHITGKAFLDTFGISPGSYRAYALTDQDFVALARSYGRVGGMDRMATLIKAIRAERGNDRTLLLDGGDTLLGSYTALNSKGADMASVIEALGVEATVGHWEFTLGAARVAELYGDREKPGKVKTAFLAGNVRENEFEDPVFKSTKFFEKGGVKIAVIGQAFPFTPIANPRWLVPEWTFGIRETDVRKHVAAARAAGAEIVILLSHNGFDVDRKLASRVAGIDVILTGHTHDAIPVPVKVGSTLLIASGSSTKFLSRLDLEVKNGRVVDYAYALIPVLADAIAPDPDMAGLIADIRAPHKAMLDTELARTEAVLYRRGNFAGPLDDMIGDAMLTERDAELSFSPGTRWGASLLPGQAITWDDIYNATALTYPKCYRMTMPGKTIKDILEDVADNIFHADPYYQQGGDMVRVGGMSFSIYVDSGVGNRIADMVHLKSGKPIEAGKDYVVAGWASVNEATQGPPIWNVVGDYLKRQKVVKTATRNTVNVVRHRDPAQRAL
ncbi:MAG: thiosulfohydrolase SoxB [Proteobacteria bacterium]|nr:thiosulfohydrolase SoxB [Pseudomonadota bacterium]